MVFLKNTKDRWGWGSIFFHWITFFTVTGLFVLGLWMVDLTYYDEWYREAPFLHKSIGVVLFLFTGLRIIWRNAGEIPDPLNEYTAFEIKAARFMHAALYFLLIVVMFTGYLVSTADAYSIDVFGVFKVPAVFYGFESQEDIAGIMHLIIASILIGFVLFHGFVAIKHHLINKDRTLKRMSGL